MRAKAVQKRGRIMSSFRVRTDLAVEVRENMEENAKECRGVSVE